MEFKDIDKGVFSESFLMDTQNKNSHAEIHEDKDAAYALNRLFTEDINSSSTFESKEQAEDLISETISYKKNEINNWLYDSNEPTHIIHLKFPKEDYESYVGKGFRKHKDKIMEYVTENICCVLKRDYDRPYGFTLTTAYPDLMSDTAIPTHKDISEILKQTEEYQKSSPVKKAYMQYQISRSDDKLSVKYCEDKSVSISGVSNEFISIEERVGKTNIFNRFKITEDDIIMTTVEKSKYNKPKKVLSDIMNITKTMRSDDDKPKLDNSLLIGANQAAFRSLHPKTCNIVNAIFNNIRENSGKPLLDITKVEIEKPKPALMIERNKDDEKTIV